MSCFLFFYLAILFSNNFLISESCLTYKESDVDVTLVGHVMRADGIGKRIVNFIDYFKDKLSINYIETYKSDYQNINQSTLDIITNKNKNPGKVALLFALAFQDHVAYVPNDSIIKIAASVFESTQIPPEWVYNLNKYFDAVVVPSSFLIKVYKQSGVVVPVFLLDEGSDLDRFLNAPIKKKKNEIFTFGMSAGVWPRKNHELLIKAFLNKFANNKNVRLKIHGRPGCERTRLNLEEIMKKYNPSNVKLILKSISCDKYFKFMNSLDVYVMPSKAEGFSFTPRESIALGVPTILSNNTSHKPLCQTQYFIPVKSDIKEPADYTWITGDYQGYNFNMHQTDLENALEFVYNNYDYCLGKANQGREWVKKFTYKNLEKKYLNLIKPKKIILGAKDVITDDYIMTTSKELYEKYNLIGFDSK